MEESTYEFGSPEARPKMAPWLIVVLILLGVCVALVLLPLCVIVILALLGPGIGNVFENIILNI